MVEQHQRRCTVPGIRLLKNFAPDRFGAAQDFGNELPHGVSGRASRRLPRIALRCNLLGYVQHGARIKAQEVRNDSDGESAQANPATDAHPAPVLEVVARILIAQLHVYSSSPKLRHHPVSYRSHTVGAAKTINTGLSGAMSASRRHGAIPGTHDGANAEAGFLSSDSHRN